VDYKGKAMTTLRSQVFARLGLPILFSAAVLAGCVSVGPDYHEPDTPVPAGWHAVSGKGLAPDPPDAAFLSRWWEGFGDRELTALVHEALQGNLDLAIARARIREAKARRDISMAGFLPFLDASASVTKSDGGDGPSRSLYDASLDARWELDLFGGTRRSVEAAQASYESSEEAFNAALVSLCAEIGINYLNLCTYRERLRVARLNAANQEETYRLARNRYEAGLADALDLEQASSALESTRAGIPVLEDAVEACLNRLCVLTGAAPGALRERLSKTPGLPPLPSTVALGVPADILRRRPDIRRAERELAAQSARVGIAASDLYPKLTLNGTIQLSAERSSELFSSGSRTIGWGPALSVPVFHWGTLKKGVEVQDALLEQAGLSYRATVLSALEEVENAVSSYAKEAARLENLEKAQVSAQKAFEIAKASYASGNTDFSRLLEAERTLLAAQDSLAQSKGSLAVSLVRLYKVLGGGWPYRPAGMEGARGAQGS